MAETKRRRRRKGKEAFLPGEEPMDHQPYHINSFYFERYLPDWLDGWYEGKDQFFRSVDRLKEQQFKEK